MERKMAYFASFRLQRPRVWISNSYIARDAQHSTESQIKCMHCWSRLVWVCSCGMFCNTVLVMDKRNHIGGAWYDYIDVDTGIRVPKYGAHLFHTSSTRVWEYLQKFSEWIPYNHSELVLVNDKYVPIPVNIDSVNTLLDLNISSAKEMDARLE